MPPLLRCRAARATLQERSGHERDGRASGDQRDGIQILALLTGRAPYTLRMVLTNNVHELSLDHQTPLWHVLNDKWNACWERTGTAAENDEQNGDPEPGLRFYCQDGRRANDYVLHDALK